jgi:hypothetical protein
VKGNQITIYHYSLVKDNLVVTKSQHSKDK